MEELEFKGTKGEWHSCCKDATPHYLFAGDGETTICAYVKEQDFRPPLSVEEMQANAKLIDASLELLESLIDVVRISDRKHKAWDRAKQAIIKALK